MKFSFAENSNRALGLQEVFFGHPLTTVPTRRKSHRNDAEEQKARLRGLKRQPWGEQGLLPAECRQSYEKWHKMTFLGSKKPPKASKNSDTISDKAIEQALRLCPRLRTRRQAVLCLQGNQETPFCATRNASAALKAVEAHREQGTVRARAARPPRAARRMPHAPTPGRLTV